jgi:hypothetical protein
MIGNQKSGTTAIAALLSMYTKNSVTIDIRGIRGYNNIQLFTGQIDFTDFVKKNKFDFSKKIIKEPSLTFYHDALKKMFPHSTFVLIVRDPRDNIRSILNRVSLEGNCDDIDLDSIPGLPIAWKHIIDSRWLGVKGNSYIDYLAERWNMAVDVYLNNEVDMILVRYEDFNKDKVKSIAKLARELELTGKCDISDSVDIQFQPAGNRAVSWKKFFGEKNLLKINRRCSERMKLLGYSIEKTGKVRTNIS